MLTKQRHQYLLDLLQQQGQVIAKTIAEELALSEDTIRRDLRELAKQGLVQRVHGGALPISPALGDFNTRLQIGSEEKAQIAKAAVSLIQAGQTIFLDGGTTTQQVVRQLPKDLTLTVVTHSPSIALDLVAYPNIEVILIGGKLFKHSIVTVGASALEAIHQLRVDLYFMGVTGVHASYGLTTGDLEEATMKRAISQQAAETIVLASSEKLDKVSPYTICAMHAVSSVMVNREVSWELAAKLEALGVAVIRA
ncbi:DeoR/GlpR family DNA-binding transcription regulator [uncultured Thiothrix sp.]|uniref:DeoR/GlpR family DNA-binding transcription regulator n=1 Tax=uncultured Thiothrix sp. TaxID=223185 RepID=UPI0026378559|nr:DeoR/GlpR family DNA-binding transcription regulator [uncultured Thiothrix sp.]